MKRRLRGSKRASTLLPDVDHAAVGSHNDFFGDTCMSQVSLFSCAEHDTNLTGASPVTGIYRQV